MATQKKNETPAITGLMFGVEPPSATRASRYVELYDALRTNPGVWADVTDAIVHLAKEAGASKIPTPQASTITLRNQGFEATSRKGEDGGSRVYAMAPVTEAE